jgi:hypothetical protein
VDRLTCGERKLRPHCSLAGPRDGRCAWTAEKLREGARHHERMAELYRKAAEIREAEERAVQ